VDFSHAGDGGYPLFTLATSREELTLLAIIVDFAVTKKADAAHCGSRR
jgi:hypothetical protein